MIRVNIIRSYWYDDDENAKLSEQGMRKFHTITQIPRTFDKEDDFLEYIDREGLEYNGSWYEWPDISCISRIFDYGAGGYVEYKEMSAHIIEERDWHLYEDGKTEHDIVY